MRLSPAGIWRRLVSEKGVVLIAVLIFMAAIVPITILILDSVRIESLIPLNENYAEIAQWQAELGYYEAASLLIEGQNLVGVDPSRVLSNTYEDPFTGGPVDYIYRPSNDNTDLEFIFHPGTHRLDYLAEPWAKHPENDTYFLAERSLENTDHPLNLDFGTNPELSSVPARWIFQNVPLGLDDFGELIEDQYSGEQDAPGLVPDYEDLSGYDIRPPVGATHTQPHSITQYNPGAGNDSFDWPIVSYLDPTGNHVTGYVPDRLWWETSPADPAYIWPNKFPRPASYFRNNTTGVDAYAADDFVYDSLFDGQNSTNQYLPNAELQEAVTDSTWANTFFGNSFTNNKEYKPQPGSIYPAPLGTEGTTLPAWHETIVSDESGRFPINILMNIVFSSDNLDYNDDGTANAPVTERDTWDDAFYDEPITDNTHTNHAQYLLARDMVISLLMTDEEMRGTDPLGAYQYYKNKAEWLLRQMMYKRYMLDLRSDYNGDGINDVTWGENDYLGVDQELDGNGRMGDAPDMWDGTWKIYDNPKNILTDYSRDNPPNATRLTLDEFKRLNERVTVYSFDTECVADFQMNDPGEFLRININRIEETDNSDTKFVNEKRGWDILRSNAFLGRERARSILWWRDGLVDLNGDGDLDDEFVELPIKDATGDVPITTITYRERNNPNYQDPTLLTLPDPTTTPPTPSYPAYFAFDPDYVNIPSMGSLLTIPMSTQTTQIVYSLWDGTGLDIYKKSSGTPGIGTNILNHSAGDDYQYPNSNMLGTQFLFEIFNRSTNAESDLNTSDMNGATVADTGLNGWHPSYNGNGQRLSYIKVDTGTGDREIFVANVDGTGETSVTGGVPALDIPNSEDIGFQLNELLEPVIGFRPFPEPMWWEIAGPDWSPSQSYPEEIVFAQGDGLPWGTDPTTTSTNLAIIDSDGTGYRFITPRTTGIHDLNPVFTQDGSGVVFTRMDLRGWDPNGGAAALMELLTSRVQLAYVPRTGGAGWWMPMWPPAGEQPIGFPVLPTISPDGTEVAFCAIDRDGASFGIDIYRMPLFGGEWAPMVETGILGWAWCPDWGNGPILPAEQDDRHGGSRVARPLASLTGLLPTDREGLAAELQDASLALRINLGNGVLQQYRYRDLPAVSSLQVEALKAMYDKFTVRDPVVYNATSSSYVIQAYGPKININTATRPVMRTILLAMFQGPVWDDWGLSNYTTGPAPRGDISATTAIIPINLLDIGLSDDARLLALQIADTYAHQIAEYRRWVYNNQGIVGVTEETVPDPLALLTAGGPESQTQNYRANPFYPIDLDQDPSTIDKPFYDPAPPFRSIADLFRIMVYEYNVNSSPWRIEGIDSTYGPDPVDLPETIDISTGNPMGGYNALDVWGPIYVESGEMTVTHGGPLDALGASVALSGFDNRYLQIGAAVFNDFYVHQQFRLFSADDFKRVEPYLTTRTYSYRIESRGVVRIASGVNRMDITRDKLWIVSTNRDAFIGYDTDGDPGPADGNTNDYYWLINADANQPLSILTYEDTPQGGFKLARDRFVP